VLAVTRNLVDTGTITIRREGGDKPQEFFKATFTHVKVGDIQLAEQQAGRIVEQVKLFPRTLTLEFRPTNQDGSLGAAITSTINCP
jgi:type VI protein secretion system component Hcp